MLKNDGFLYLTNADLIRAGLYDWPAHFRAIVQAFHQLAVGTAIMTPKVRLSMPGDLAHWTGYGAYLGDARQRVSFKWLTRMHGDSRLPGSLDGLVLLSDASSGRIIAVMQAGGITAVRTAVTTAVASTLLVHPNAHTLGIVGAGVMGDFHLRALPTLLPQLRRVVLWNRTRSRAESLASTVRNRVEVVIAESPEILGQQSDLLVCAVEADTPLIQAEWLRPGITIVDVGEMACEVEVLLRADLVFVDWRERVVGSGLQTLDRAVATGRFELDRVAGDLVDLLQGKGGRRTYSEIVYLASAGLAIQDAAVASSLYENATRQGIGRWLRLGALR